MTRKRYIKLLMSLGIERNEAATMAECERKDKTPYAESWEHINDPMPVPAFADIDELHKMGSLTVAAAIEAGAAAKSGPVIMINSGAMANWPPRFDWPPTPQPAAGCLYAIDTAQLDSTSKQWLKENPHADDILDALRYAVEAMYYRQGEAQL